MCVCVVCRHAGHYLYSANLPPCDYCGCLPFWLLLYRFARLSPFPFAFLSLSRSVSLTHSLFLELHFRTRPVRPANCATLYCLLRLPSTARSLTVSGCSPRRGIVFVPPAAPALTLAAADPCHNSAACCIAPLPPSRSRPLCENDRKMLSVFSVTV